MMKAFPPFASRVARKGLQLLSFLLALLSLPRYCFFPRLSHLRVTNPALSSFMAICNKKRAKRGLSPVKQPRWTSLEAFPPYVTLIVVLAEDANMPGRGGVSWTGAKHALVRNIGARAFVAGGSGITQQLARNLFLKPDKTLIRKLQEALLAWRLHRLLEPRRIVELYLNVVEWGSNVFGIHRASFHHFGVPPHHLTPLQGALLSGILPAARRYSPTSPFVRIKAKHVLTGLIQARSARLRDYLQLPGHRPRPVDSKDDFINACRNFAIDLHRTRTIFPGWRKGCQSYTVAVIIHTKEQRLDALLQSLLAQSLNFNAHIQVLVLDLLGDKTTRAHLHQWEEKCSKNISVCAFKANSLSQARNHAIGRARTDWITFINATDSVDHTYFFQVDALLRCSFKEDNRLPIRALLCKTFIYHRPLHYQRDWEPCFGFKGESQRLSRAELDSKIHLSSHAVFFHVKTLQEQGTRFDERLQGLHDDISFFARYLYEGHDKDVLFLQTACYYLHKERAAILRSLPYAPRSVEALSEKSLLLSMEAAMDCAALDMVHGRHLLCSLAMLLLRRLVNRDTSAKSFLQEELLLDLLTRVFSRLLPDDISNFPTYFGRKSFPFATAVAYHWFGLALPRKEFRVHELLSSPKRLCLTRFCAASPGRVFFALDGKRVRTLAVEYVEHKLMSRPFIMEQRIWLDLPEQAKSLEISTATGRNPFRLFAGKRRFKSPVDLANLKESFQGSLFQMPRLYSMELDLSPEHLVQALSCLRKLNRLPEKEIPPIVRPERFISRIIIHCSATGPSHDIGAKEIRNSHVNKRGWSDIGYHYVIRRNGCIETGRPLELAGAHVAGHNADSIGICLIGGVLEDGTTPVTNFTSWQWARLEALVRSLKKVFPDAELCGHREFSNKDCPCFDAKLWWSAVSGLGAARVQEGIPPLWEQARQLAALA